MTNFITSIVCIAVIVAPWSLYASQKTGSSVVTSSNLWGSFYEALGEDSTNKWGIRLNDGYVNDIALQQGFDDAWTPQSNIYFQKKSIEYVKTYPISYLSTILVQRLPMALAPPYRVKASLGYIKSFSIIDTANNEGLSRYQVAIKYFPKVLEDYGLDIISSILSGIVFIFFVAYIIISVRKKDRNALWLFLSWGYFVGVIVLIKQVEARNLAPTIIPLTIAMASVIQYIKIRILEKRQYNDNEPIIHLG